MKVVSFYHKDTGRLNGIHVMGSDDAVIALNTPVDHIAIAGSLDALSQAVDVATGKVIDYQPPAPSADHEWNASTKRWHLTAAAVAKITARTAALAQILRLEASQNRPMRELTLGDETARARLKEIETKIAALRASL